MLNNEISVENELDVRTLFRVLWQGKVWIIGIAMGCALLALVLSFIMQQQWSATAITDKPSINRLGSYYSQQQFLRNLERYLSSKDDSVEPSIVDQAYHEFVMQLSSYDTRRDFWLQSQYFQTQKANQPHADAELLDKLIDNIQFTAADDSKKTNDSVRLVAETATNANQLLRQYVIFANQRAVEHLNTDLQGSWAARTVSMRAQVKRLEEIATAIYQREINGLQQSIKIAREQGVNDARISPKSEAIPASDLFLLGRPLLQARLEALQASGPSYDAEYDRDSAMLNTLKVGPKLTKTFQAYRYLRTPEVPVKRDSPRRLFIMVMWGVIGALIGAGMVLVRRKPVAAH